MSLPHDVGNLPQITIVIGLFLKMICVIQSLHALGECFRLL